MSELRRVHGTSRNIEALDFVADPSHFRKYSVDAHVEDSKRVLENDAIRLCFRKHAQSSRPLPTVIAIASALPGTAGWLAWWTSCENRDACVLSAVEFVNVGMDRELPGLFEETSAAFVSLAKSNGVESCPLCGKGEAAKSAKEVEMGETIHTYCIGGASAGACDGLKV